MLRSRSLILSLAVSIAASGLTAWSPTASAGKATDLPTTLAKPGVVVIHEGFDSASLPQTWTTTKGEWKPVDGALVGKELKTDMHAGVIAVGGKHRDSIVRLSFQLGGVKQFSVSLNKEQGHLFRVVINEQGISLVKDPNKKDPKSKPVTLSKANGAFKPNEWYTIQLEIVGDKVTVQTDNGLKVEGQNAELNTDKVGYRFVVSGESVKLDDLMVWDVRK